MDKKSRKRMQVLKDKLQSRRQQLASAKKQPDEAREAERLMKEILALESELEVIKMLASNRG
ncbi:MAG: hypothetical protein WD768_12075 [Phycisphaeraceae bacterium]